MREILDLIAAERKRQDEKWGVQDHPDGTSHLLRKTTEIKRAVCQAAFAGQRGSWRVILDEEVAEAAAEEDPVKLKQELIQVAAVCVAWIESIDRRSAVETHEN